MSVAPTLAVGLGNAGCSMVSALRDMAKDEGINNRFRFVGIDTNNEDLQSNIDFKSPDVTKFHLEAPKQWSDNSYDYHYLDASLLSAADSIKASGALTKRRIGRYYVDSHINFNRLETRLTAVIEQFSEEFESDLDEEDGKMHIWILNSLGGGTGSGSFPVVAGMIKHITRLTNRATHDYKIYGLGTLPNTTNVTQEYHNYYLNSYAALRDIQVLTGNDPDAESDIQLGENRKGLPEDDRFDLPNIVFDGYFLQPFNQSKMKGDAYRYQLNKSSAAVPLYFAKVKGREDWPKEHTELINRGIYAFDTYELAVPVEDIYRYFDTSERINELDDQLENLRSERVRVTDDIAHINDVFDFDVDSLITQHKEEREIDEAQMTEVIPEEVSIPDSLAYDMVDTARSAVGGLSLGDNNSVEKIDETIDDRYENDWDDTNTSHLEHKSVFQYVFYQLAERKAIEEQRDHGFNDLINSRWEEYRGELEEEFAFLNNKNPAAKWQDGLSKFYDDKIESIELPMGALFGAGFVLLLAILLTSSLLLNISFIQRLAETSVPLASIPVSIASALIGILVLVSAVLAGYYLVPFLKKKSLENERDECRDMYEQYSKLEEVEETMAAKYDRIGLNKVQLKEQKSELISNIETSETLLDNQKSVRQTVVNRLGNFEFEFDRKVAFPVREPEKLKPDDTDTDEEDVASPVREPEKVKQPGIKKKTWEYVQNKQSLGTELVNREIFDGDIQMDWEYESVDTTEQIPDSITWFQGHDLIRDGDINNAFDKILGKGQSTNTRLAECPLINRTNEDPSQDREILQYVWNPINDNITEAEGGGEPYGTLVGDYDRQNDVSISDEFRVWMMGVYTNLHFENMAVYNDINKEYADSSGDGDTNVVDALDIPEGAYGASSFMTKRIAYPEFYDAFDHPISEEVESYPE